MRTDFQIHEHLALIGSAFCFGVSLMDAVLEVSGDGMVGRGVGAVSG
jgi:hypothetical protein